MIRESYTVLNCFLLIIDPLLSRSKYQVSDLYERAGAQQHLHFGYVVNMTCIRRSSRQPIVAPDRRRTTSQRGHMGTCFGQFHTVAMLYITSAAIDFLGAIAVHRLGHVASLS